jgi:hypothetical protein
MPTATINGISILDAVVNGPSTPTQRQRVLDAFGSSLAPSATTEQKAAQFVSEVSQFIIRRVRHEETIAAGAAVAADFAVQK